MAFGLGGINIKSLSTLASSAKKYALSSGSSGDLLSSQAAKSLDPRGNQIAQIITAQASGLDPRGNQIAPIISRALGSTGPSHQPTDRRIRIRAKTPSAAGLVYGPQGDSNILSVLHSTGGVVFPYTPIINVNFSAEWTPYSLSHSNYQTQSYARSIIEDITISGQFTAQNQEEAFYMFACMHFFKSMTKMYYGEKDPKAGTTPPVLALNGYGTGQFNDLPVVVKGYTQEFNDSVDMVQVFFNGGEGNAWVPVMSNLIVTLGVTHDLKRVRDQFNLDAFKSGQLLTSNKGF